jgi:hypothetical protein
MSERFQTKMWIVLLVMGILAGTTVRYPMNVIQITLCSLVLIGKIYFCFLRK